MVDNSFFDEQREQSLVKSTIVEKYFFAWANVIINTQKKYPQLSQKIAYIDLFAGPGRFKDGTQSTPCKILESAIDNPDLCQRLVSLFNDKDDNNSRSLEQTINSISNLDKLKFKPQISNEEVGTEIVEMFETMNLIPTLFFVDPWGYKGLSLRLIDSVLKDWGCDAIFFFNYNRISMGINNSKVKKHMQALFGDDEVDKLQKKLIEKKPIERELIVIENLCQQLKTYGSRYVLPFRFKDNRGKRTSHHLIFVSKHFRGYEIMKDIMARESSSNTDGVPSFEYNPADLLPKHTLLFQFTRPLEDLRDDLLKEYNDQKITMCDIYEDHNVDTPFIKSNYKKVLRELYDEGKIKAISTKGKAPRKGTFGDTIEVTFPKRHKNG